MAAKAYRVYVMPSLNFVRKFDNLNIRSATLPRFYGIFKVWSAVPAWSCYLKKIAQIHGGSEAPVVKIQDFNDLYLCQ